MGDRETYLLKYAFDNVDANGGRMDFSRRFFLKKNQGHTFFVCDSCQSMEKQGAEMLQ